MSQKLNIDLLVKTLLFSDDYMITPILLYFKSIFYNKL